MSTLRNWFAYMSKEVPKEFLASIVSGTSETIPGQGSDLATIIQSIVKLPPQDPKNYDGTSDDNIEEMMLRREVEGLYPATGANLAEEISARKRAAKEQAPTIDAKEERIDDAKE